MPRSDRLQPRPDEEEDTDSYFSNTFLQQWKRVEAELSEDKYYPDIEQLKWFLSYWGFMLTPDARNQLTSDMATVREFMDTLVCRSRGEDRHLEACTRRWKNNKRVRTRSCTCCYFFNLAGNNLSELTKDLKSSHNIEKVIKKFNLQNS